VTVSDSQHGGQVDEGWRRYFEALPAAPGAAPAPEAFPPRRPNGHAAAPAAGKPVGADAAFQAKVDRLVHAYRDYGHLRADLDPLGLTRRASPFTLGGFGLSEADRSRRCADPEGRGEVTLGELVARLEETYCRTLGVELAHMHDADLRAWLEARMERTRNRCPLPEDVKRRLLEKIVEAEALEQFLATKFLGAKRFSLEGAEGLVPLFELLVDRAIGHGVRNVAIGMAHRGRLNVLANVLHKPLSRIFAEFRDNAIVNAPGGDVKYHLGYSSDRETPDGVLVHLSLSFNPSHLEWIDTVVQGRIRAKQDRYKDGDRSRSVAVLVHGDAAFAGQGIVAEAFNMSELEAYSVGGTIHVIVNNQVGFTTSPKDARSTTYPTGPARMLQIPVIHVNGEDMEAVAQAVLLAVDFRQRFHRDVVIDLWTYRRHGHNEGDEPSFTQPVMYRAIARKPTLRALYSEQLVREGAAAPSDVQDMTARYRARLDEAYSASAKIAVQPGADAMQGYWKEHRGGPIGRADEGPTAVALQTLRDVGKALVHVPQGFVVHPKLAKVIEARRGGDPAKSYVARLFGKGTDAILKKIGEEATETVMACKDGDTGKIVHEVADLWFHSMLALAAFGLSPADVLNELERRETQSGLEEFAARKLQQREGDAT